MNCWKYHHDAVARKEMGGDPADVIQYREPVLDRATQPTANPRPEVPVDRRKLSKPRVLFVSHDLSLSGAPIILANLIPHLRGIVSVLYSPKDGPLRSRIERSGVPVVVGLCPELDGFDLMVANTVASPVPSLISQSRKDGLPVVWMIHESDPSMFDLDAINSVIGYPDRVIFPCRETANSYRRGRSSRIDIIPTIIPPVVAPIHAGPSYPFQILTTGRNEPRKGQIDIWSAVEGLDGVEVRIADGSVSNMRNMYSYADLYICSSRVEAYPLALQEAKAHGLPVITTPVFGCKEIIQDKIDGLHYQPGDVSDLQKKIWQIRDDRDLREKLSKPLTHLPSFGETVARYEDVFLRCAGAMPITPQPVTVVYHSAGGWGSWWRDVVREQFAQLADAGLCRVFGTHVGDDPRWVQDEAASAGLDYVPAFCDPDWTLAEAPAIRLIQRMARNNNTPVLYLHSKGVSHDPAREPMYHDWRRLMMQELVSRWRDHVPLLGGYGGYDAIGVNWWRNHPHFSGNFWMASSDWLRKLPDFDQVYKDRYTCERWIGMGQRCRFKSLVCSDKKFWVPGPDQEAMYAAIRGATVAPKRVVEVSKPAEIL